MLMFKILKVTGPFVFSCQFSLQITVQGTKYNSLYGQMM